MDNPSRWQRFLTAIKPATVRGAIVRLVIFVLTSTGVGGAAAALDPEKASAYFLMAVTVAEFATTVLS